MRKRPCILDRCVLVLSDLFLGIAQSLGTIAKRLTMYGSFFREDVVRAFRSLMSRGTSPFRRDSDYSYRRSDGKHGGHVEFVVSTRFSVAHPISRDR